MVYIAGGTSFLEKKVVKKLMAEGIKIRLKLYYFKADNDFGFAPMSFKDGIKKEIVEAGFLKYD